MKVKYKDKYCAFVQPLSIIIPGAFAFTSSGDRPIFAEYIIDRYFPEDNDPNMYKVKMLPTSKYSMVAPKEYMYVDCIQEMSDTPYQSGKGLFIKKKQLFNRFVQYIKENGICKNNSYELKFKNDLSFTIDKCKVKKIILPLDNYKNIMVHTKGKVFTNKVKLFNYKDNASEIMARIIFNNELSNWK